MRMVPTGSNRFRIEFKNADAGEFFYNHAHNRYSWDTSKSKIILGEDGISEILNALNALNGE